MDLDKMKKNLKQKRSEDMLERKNEIHKLTKEKNIKNNGQAKNDFTKHN